MIRTTVHLRLPRPDPIYAVAAFWFAVLLLVCAAVGLTTPAAADEAETQRVADVVYVVATPTALPEPWQATAIGVKAAPPPPEPQVVYEVVYVPVPAAPMPQIDTTPEGGSETASTRGRP